jgi:RHS repeat-associated protein
MKLSSIKTCLLIAVKSVSMGVIIGILNIQLAFAGPPMWWTNRQVWTLDGSSNPVPAADFAIVNQGQLKSIARKAYDELKAALPVDAWSTPEGQALESLVAGWYDDPGLLIPKIDTVDYSAVNQGQLKNVAKRFYDLFSSQGIDVSDVVGETLGVRKYPWSDSTLDDANFSLVTIGQLKHVFSFGADVDLDGLSDWWETRIVNLRPDDAITSINQITPGGDLDGDGLTNLEEFKARTDATRYSMDVPTEGLQLWVKGDAGITQSASGRVSNWNDQSGKGHHLAMTDASRQPALRSNTLNSFGVIGFDGADDFLQPTVATSFTNNFTTFIVARTQTQHQVDAVSDSGTAGLSGQRYLLFPPQAGVNAGAGLSVGTNGITVYEHGDNYMPARAVYSGSGMAGTGFKTIELAYQSRQPSVLLNGLSVATGAASPRNTVVAGSELGGSLAFASTNNFFEGDVGEVFIYDRVLTTAERKMIRNHLAYRWLDADGDNLPDGWEIANGFDPANPLDGSYDTDGDNLTNRREYELGSDPRDKDSGINKIMVGQWKLDEGSGSIARDSSGNNNHGNVTVGSQWTTGMDGTKALALNGTNQSVSVFDTSDEEFDFGLKQSFTLSFWFKSNGTGVQRVMGKGSKFQDWTSGFFAGVGYTGSGHVDFGLGANGSLAGSLLFGTTASSNDDVWHHAAIVVDRTTFKAGIYIDGTQRAIQKWSGTAGGVVGNDLDFAGFTAMNGTSSEKLTLGSHLGTSEFFKGAIDDLRVFGGVLKPAEIQRLVTDVDTDGDGIPNWWETTYGLNPALASDASLDPDRDGITNLQEFRNGTDPKQVAMPTFDRLPGSYPTQFYVHLSSETAGATIRYTTNDSDPDEDSPVVPAAGVLVDRGMTVKARAYLEGKNPSEVAAAAYFLTGAIAAGYNHILVQRSDLKVFGWGKNGTKQLDKQLPNNFYPVPTELSDLSMLSIAAFSGGSGHSLALLGDSTVQAWGSNAYLECGADDSITYADLTQIREDGTLAILNNVIQVTVGDNFSAALTSSGLVRTWGSNSDGQLGININNDLSKRRYAQTVVRFDPVLSETTLTSVKKIAAGGAFCLALDTNGDLWSWGRNGSGQLGLGDLNHRVKAHQITDSDVANGIIGIGVGRYNGFAIKEVVPGDPSQNVVFGWGDNTEKQVGANSSAGNVTAPIPVLTDLPALPALPLKGVTSIVGGEFHVIALTSDGRVWGWGKTQSGRLGVLYPGESTSAPRPYARPIRLTVDGEELTDVIAIDAGANYSLALKRDGTVIVWGANDDGQHGNGGTVGSEAAGGEMFSWHSIIDQREYVDTDRDGYPDLYELANGSNPNLAPTSTSPITPVGAIPAPTFVVDSDGEGDFVTIQEAIDAVDTDFAVIEVAAGTYYGSIEVKGRKMLLKSREGAANTIIDAFRQPGGITVRSDSVISGFTIKDAEGDAYGLSNNGGGIYIDKCRPIFIRCYVTANTAKNGAGIYNNAGSPTFQYCTIAMNNSIDSDPGPAVVSYGPAIYSNGLRTRFENSLLFNQTASTEAGGAGANVTKSIASSSQASSGLFGDWTAYSDNFADVRLLSSGHITLGSVLIRTSPTGLVPPPADMDNEPWDQTNGLNPGRFAPDIGVDEYNDTDGDEIPDWWELENKDLLSLDPNVPDSGGKVDSTDPAELTHKGKYDEFVALSFDAEDPPEAEPDDIMITVDDLDLSPDGDQIVRTPLNLPAVETPDGQHGLSYYKLSHPGESVEFIPNIPESGSYEVRMWWPKGSFGSAKIDVLYANGERDVVTPVTVNQQRPSKNWLDLGTFAFRKGTAGRVIVKASANGQPVAADAVSFVKIDPAVVVRAVGKNFDRNDHKAAPRSAWIVRNLARVPGVTATKVRISRRPGASFSFRPNLKVPGTYRVYIRHQKLGNKKNGRAEVHVYHSNGVTAFTGTSGPTPSIDQASQRGSWVPLGTYQFPGNHVSDVTPPDDPDASAPQVKVTVPSGNPSDRWITADAVRFEKVSDEMIVVDDGIPATNFRPYGAWTARTQNSGVAVGFARSYNLLTGTQRESDEFEMSARNLEDGIYGVFVYAPSGTGYVSDAVVNVNGWEWKYNQQRSGQRWLPLGEARVVDGNLVARIRRGNNTGKLAADAIALVRDPDSDHDGLVDAWERRWGMNPNDSDEDDNQQKDGLDDFDGDGQPNWEEAANNKDPYQAYDGTTFLVQKFKGDRQMGGPGDILEKPLIIKVTDAATGNFLPNALVRFSILPKSVTSGDSDVTAGAALGTSAAAGFTHGSNRELNVRVNLEGEAHAYVRLPDLGGQDLKVQAVSGNVTQTFTLVVTGLSADWRLDDGEGSVASDSAGFNYHGVVQGTGATWASSGEQGWRKTLRFDGATSSQLHIANTGFNVLPESSSAAGYQPYSVSFWFRPETVSTTHQAIFSHAADGGIVTIGTVRNGGDPADTTRVYFSWPKAPAVLQEIISSVPADPSKAVVKDKWNHAAVSSDGVSVTLYVNGIVGGTWSAGGTPPAPVGIPSSTADLIVGGSAYIGQIDEVQAYRGIMTLDDAIQLAVADSDGDGMDNDWELQNGLDIFDPNDAWDDPDEDGVFNIGEYRLRTNPHFPTTNGVADGSGDQDSDGMLDGFEANYGLKRDEDDAFDDADGDVYPNVFEFAYQTNPLDATSKPAATYVVEKKRSSYESIQSAINAAASAADAYPVILVQPETYAENLSVQLPGKRLLLVSQEGARATRIDGGGIGRVINATSSVAIAGFDITNGSTTESGGGVRASGATTKVQLTSSIVRGNTASAGGAALAAEAGASIKTLHCTITGNTGPTALNAAAGASLKITNSISWNTSSTFEAGATVTGRGSCVRMTGSWIVNEGGCIGDSANFNPELVPDGHLKWNSPCLDQISASGVPIRDWDGDGRLASRIDIGIDEFIDSDGDHAPDYWEAENDLDPNDPRDGEWDADGDGTSNHKEYEAGSSPWDGGAFDPTIDQPGEGDPTLPQNVAVPGSTPGELSVGADGSAVYNVPLFIPKGTAGMEPKLALVYSSRAGNGSLGLGWSIAGLSTITRGPATLAQDDVVRGPTYAEDDQYYLDGKRLIPLGNNKYETEVRSFAQITKIGNEWEMKTKSNLTMRLKPVLTRVGVTYAWGVSKVSDDLKGNYFLVNYDQSGGEQNTGEPLSIVYTGNNGVAGLNLESNPNAYNRIEFEYRSRPDKQINYVNGQVFKREKLLKGIKMYSEGQLAREYFLFYKFTGSTARARLVRLVELGAQLSGQATRERFHDLTFDWQGWRNIQDQGWQEHDGWASKLPDELSDDRGSRGAIFMDVNGDGFPDLIWSRFKYHDGPQNLELPGTPDPDIEGGAFLNPGAPGKEWIFSRKHEPPCPLVAEGGADTGARFVDIDGDGLQDLVAGGKFKVVDSNNVTQKETRELKGLRKGIWKLDPNLGWIRKADFQLKIVDLKSDGSAAGDERTVQFADLNGDGRSEMLVANQDYSVDWNGDGVHEKTIVHQLSGWNLKPVGYFPSLLVGINHGFPDLTGDGLPELIYNRKNDGRQLYKWKKTGGTWSTEAYPQTNFVNMTTEFPWDGDAFNDAGARFLDANGDGLPDYAFARHGSLVRHFKLSKGNGSWTDTGTAEGLNYAIPAGVALSASPSDADNEPLDLGARFSDLNGDGLVDLLVGVDYPGYGTLKLGYINTGTHWQQATAWNPAVYFAKGEQHPDPSKSSKKVNVPQGVQLVDINSDGFPDIVKSRPVDEGDNEDNRVFINRSKPQVIVQVRNGNSAIDRVTYSSLTSPGVYTRGSGAIYPMADTVSPMTVVSRVSRSTNQNPRGGLQFTHTDYRYHGLRVHLKGRGSLGFCKVIAEQLIDDNCSISTATTYNQKFPLVGTVDATERKLHRADGTVALLAATNNAWIPLATNVVVSGQPNRKLHFTYVSKSVVDSYELNGVRTSRVKSGFDYDVIENAPYDQSFGNLIRSTIDSGAGVTKTIVNKYADDPEAKRLGRLESSEVTHTSATGSVTRKSQFTYEDGGLGNLDTERPEPGRADFATTNHDYDAFGNEKRTETAGEDLSGIANGEPVLGTSVTRWAESTFDPKGRFVVSSKNSKNHTVTTQYNRQLGVPTSVTDANGLTAQTPSHDSFGRPLLSVAPDGTESVTEYQWADFAGNTNDPIAQQAIYWVKKFSRKTIGGNTKVLPYSRVWYDRLGREIRKEAEHPDGRIVYQDTDYDKFGRISQTSTPYFKDSPTDSENPRVWTKIEYDRIGRKKSVTTKHDRVEYSHIEYDQRGRKNGGVEVITRVKRNRDTKNANGKTVPGELLITRTRSNAAGQIVEVEDNAKQTLSYEYDPAGALNKIIGVDGEVTTIKFDDFGRKEFIIDPGVGRWDYKYNDFGELVWQKDAKGQIDLTYRDELGRVFEQVELASGDRPERKTTTTYDTSPKEGGPDKWLGLVHLVELREGGLLKYTTSTGYDALGRVNTATSTHHGAAPGGGNIAYSSLQSYDVFGRPTLTTAPGNVVTENVYTDNGFLTEVKRHAYQVPNGGPSVPAMSLWKVEPGDVNAAGKPIKEKLRLKDTTQPGNQGATHIELNHTYDPVTARLVGDRATVEDTAAKLANPNVEPVRTLQNNTYEYDLIGTLLKRTSGSKIERFGYDELNRLVRSQVEGLREKIYKYEPNGNLIYKSDVGTYEYKQTVNQHIAGPHAVSTVRLDTTGQAVNYEYDANGNMVNGPVWGFTSSGRRTVAGDRTIFYSQNDKPYQINDTGTGASLTMRYGPGDALIEKKSITAAGTTTTRYLGGFEEEEFSVSGGSSSTVQRHHYGGAVFSIKTVGGTTTLSTHFLLKDHLGSTDVIVDEDGVILTENGQETGRYSFDPFGMRRKASDWSEPTEKIVTNASGHPVTNKGYTGHEQLDDVELVHMGGRVYDAVIGRFLTADPIVQHEAGSQSYNRYSYVQNNPLSLTDPTGYSIAGDILGYLVVGVFGIEGVRESTMDWLRANPEAAQVIVAVAAVVVTVVTLGVGTGFLYAGVGATQFFFASVVAGAAGGFTSGALSTAIAGGTGSQILSAGLKGAAVGAISAAITFGIGHGMPLDGGKFGSFGQALGFEAGGVGDTIATGLAHGVAQGAIGEATGGDFVSGFVSGFAGHLSGTLTGGLEDVKGIGGIAIRTMIAATIGGTAAELTGGSFANGAVSAAFVHLFNDEATVQFRNQTYRGYRTARNLNELDGQIFGSENLRGECAAGVQELTGAPSPAAQAWRPGNPTLLELAARGEAIPAGTAFASMGGPGGHYAGGAGNSKNWDHTIIVQSARWVLRQPNFLARLFGAKPVYSLEVRVGSQWIGKYNPDGTKVPIPFHFETKTASELIGGRSRTPYRLITGY